jgi:L-talarate/galactarate dehydratase
MTKVAGFETWVVRVPYEEGRFGTHVVLRLRTDDGLEGLGYVSLLAAWGVKPVRQTMETFAEQVIGEDPLHVEAINARLLSRGSRALGGILRSAVSAIDVALWDLKAKALGLPLYRLLGGHSNRVTAYASWELWWQYDLEALTRQALRHVDSGFRSMKYRMGGVARLEDAVERTRVLREAVGPDIDLHVDMNESWTVNQTVRIGRELAAYNLAWIEDPVPHEDYEGLRQICDSLDTPITAGESYFNTAQFVRLIEHRAADVVMIDLDVGGLSQWLKIAHLAEAHRLPVASHLATEISAHAVAAIGNGMTVEYNPWAVPIFKEVPPVEDGKLVLFDKPGLGLELEASALEKYAYG